jgi:hypothetical protein
MGYPFPVRPALTAVLLAVFAQAAAQTIEDRAARVRETLAAPPPVETVIDRGMRVLGEAQAGPAAGAVPGVDPRLVSGNAAASTPAAAAPTTAGVPAAVGMPGLTTTTSPRGTAFSNDPRGTGFLNDSRGTGTAGARSPMPGLRSVQPQADGQVIGTSNLVTGNGRASGVAP